MSPRWGRAMRAAAALLVAAPLLSPAPADAGSAGTVMLRVTPALGGVALQVGSVVVVTAGDGTAAAEVSDLNGIARRVRLARNTVGGGTLLAIRKLVPEPHTTPHLSRITVGLDVSSVVRLHIKSGDTGVPARDIRSVRLHSVTGSTITVDPARTSTVTLLARRPREVAGHLQLQTVTWSVDRIAAGPGVALTSARPRFDPYRQHSWPLVLAPVRGIVHIATVPATPDVTFLLDGASVTTARDGSVSAPVGDLNDIAARLQLASHDAGAAEVSVLDIVRQKPPAPRQRQVLVALTVRRPVDLRFVDHDGRNIDRRRITDVRLEGSSGQTLLTSAQLADPVLLAASTATQVRKVWQARPVSYAIAAVRMDGGNAVFAGKQRIAPDRSGSWVVTLSVFTLTVRVHDVLFGSRVRSVIKIERPDGSIYAVRAGTARPAVATSMVRGTYDVRVESAVFGARTKVLVSRDDAVDLRVVTLLDAVLIALAGLIVVASVVWAGIVLARRRAAGAMKGTE